jgi:hypothetical protein
MTEVTMKPRDEGFLISEANGSLSREAVTANIADTAIPAGTVMHDGGETGWVAVQGGSDPRPSADGILLRYSYGVENAVIARDAEVDGSLLVWNPVGSTELTDPQKATAIAQLEALGIVVR